MELSIHRIFNFFSPKRLIFGCDAIAQLGIEARGLGGSKALIVTDKGIVQCGLLENVQPYLDAAGISSFVFDKVAADAPLGIVEECARCIKENGIDIVIGLGGGSSIDTAKAASVMATNPGSLVDYCGNDSLRKPGLPKILIPTTAGTGSEATRVFIFTDEKAGMKKALYSDYVLADIAIVDPILTVAMPPTVTLDTGLDALIHAIEAYVSKTATPFSDLMALEAIRLIAKNLPIAYAKGDSLSARYGMSLGALTAGLAFGSGGLGAIHGLAYPLASEYHLTHGRSTLILLPHVMAFNLIGDPDKYARIGEAMGETLSDGLTVMEKAEKTLTAVQRWLSELNVSTRLRDYQIPKENIDHLAKESMKFSRLFASNPRILQIDDAKGIFEKAW